MKPRMEEDRQGTKMMSSWNIHERQMRAVMRERAKPRTRRTRAAIVADVELIVRGDFCSKAEGKMIKLEAVRWNLSSGVRSNTQS